MQADSYIEPIFEFLEKIGIPVHIKDLPEGTFLPGIRIENGSLAVDLGKLAYPGDMLHEAGHIAVMAPSRRKEIFADAGADMGEEIAAQAWSYAAAKASSVPAEVVFHENGYKGAANWMKNHYEGEECFAGLPLLAWYRLTDLPNRQEPSGNTDHTYPNMKAWLRMHDDPSFAE
jgi:hypothetical protein